MKKKSWIAIGGAVLIVLLGIAFIIVAILSGKTNKRRQNQLMPETSTMEESSQIPVQSSDPEAQKRIKELQEQVDALTKENAELKSEEYVVNASSEESIIFHDVKEDLVYSFQLFRNIQCNAGQISNTRYVTHHEFLTERLTEKGATYFFGEQTIDDILNQRNDYDTGEHEDKSYTIDTKIDCIDVMVSELKQTSEGQTVNFTVIYRVSEEYPRRDREPRKSWNIVYGQALYNGATDIWQINQVYSFRDFTTDPENLDVLLEESKKWLK